MDIPVAIDMGMEKLEAELTFAEYDAELFRLFGLISNNNIALTIRGAIQATSEAEAVMVNLRGIFKELDAGSWKAGDKTTLKCTVAVSYYKLTIDKRELIEIDIENMVRKINGNDQLATLRQALGV